MSCIDLSQYSAQIADAVDPQAVEPGEYKVRIIDCTDQKEDKNGNPYIMPRLELSDDPLAKDLTYFLGLPHSGMEAKQMAKCLAKLKHFGEAFGINFGTQLDVSDLVGLEAWAILGQEDNETYGPQNYIKSFVTGA